MKNKLVLIGILAIVLAVLAVSSVAALPIPPGKPAIVWFEPDPSSAAPGETMHVLMKFNSSVGVSSFQQEIVFKRNVVNITGATEGDYPNLFGYAFREDLSNATHAVIRCTGDTPDFENKPPGIWVLANYTLVGIGAGTTTLFNTKTGEGTCKLIEATPLEVEAEWVDGTFTCVGPEETFTKPLVTGWNLISLPLTATDMKVSNVIDTSVSGNYDALYRYDATTRSWVSLSSPDTMSNGAGYFIHMTAADTWTYSGNAYTAMTGGLSDGLNMIGWLNCSKSITDALSSIDGKYYYAARWNATTQKFETYNPIAPAGFNDFTTMDRGEGYFISMKEAATLTASC
ncbi:MAG: hypothetical protein WAV32_05150 [Halobacteriota archaeon]